MGKLSNILITGSRGNIGSHLADALEENGHKVIHYDIKDGNDILDFENFSKMSNSLDGIVHFAAVQRVITGFENPYKTIETNIMGLNNVLRIAMKSKAWVLFGSSKTVYGKPDKIPVKESADVNPSNIYSLSKLMSELIIKDFCKNYNFKGASIRFSTIFGSERDLLDRAIPTFMYKAIKNIDLKIENENRILDPAFIDDVTKVLAKIVEKLQSENAGFYDVYNMCSGNSIKIIDIVKMILEVAGSDAKIVGSTKERSYDRGDFVGDPSKIKNLFDFKATPLEDAVRIYYKRFLELVKNNKLDQSEIDFMLNYYKRDKKPKV